jgi:hypothetical protein
MTLYDPWVRGFANPTPANLLEHSYRYGHAESAESYTLYSEGPNPDITQDDIKAGG